ncbi:MAG: permease prefix domain 1-containing protein [Lachnospiraceae bacterium]
MMNKQIRRMIDEIFADMKMTADNLALRDELMANAQARFEDSVRAGKTEEEAFAEVAASLGDVQSLLREMNAEKPEDSAEETAQTETQTQSDETAEGEEAGADEPDFEVKNEKTPDIGEALRLSARWATWASRLCRRRRSWFGRWTT